MITAKGFNTVTKEWTSSATPAKLEITMTALALKQQIEVTSNRAATLMTDVPVSDVQLTREDLQETPALTLDGTDVSPDFFFGNVGRYAA